MTKKKFILTALCLVLVLGMMVSPALAYFTDYAEAEGEVAIELGYQTTIEEKMDGLNKDLSITNKADSSEACWVRAKAIAASDVTLSYEGSGWTEEGEWMVYNSILEPGDSAALKVVVTLPSGEEAAEKNVAVVYEGTKVTYAADGTPEAPDWSMAAQITEVIKK